MNKAINFDVKDTGVNFIDCGDEIMVELYHGGRVERDCFEVPEIKKLQAFLDEYLTREA